MHPSIPLSDATATSLADPLQHRSLSDILISAYRTSARAWPALTAQILHRGDWPFV